MPRLPRWSNRTWSNIGLIALAVVTVALIAANVVQNRAREAAVLANMSTPATDATAATLPSATQPAVAPLVLPTSGGVLFFGDSWTYGTAARPVKRGYAYLAAEQLGLTGDVQGVSGTGYLNRGPDNEGSYVERVSAMPAPSDPPALVVLQGGINDATQALAALPAAASETIAAMRAKFPSAAMVVLGPATSTWPVDPRFTKVDQVLADEAAKAGVHYISPLTEGWITGDNFRQVIDDSNGHPSTEGHAYLADRLVSDLRRLATN